MVKSAPILFGQDIIERSAALFDELEALPTDNKIVVLNEIRSKLHDHSPFKDEPVDCVYWIPFDQVEANDYNPNAVAPPEMKLLEHSIGEDGYTQPIVAWETETGFEVVDGFHRNRVGRESPAVKARVHSHLPLAIINHAREERGDRIAATIRHNRARRKHQVQAMSEIVIELKRRNWSDERIGKELGMEPDEILRLCQISGLSELFQDQEFSASWDVEGEVDEIDFEELTDDISTYDEDALAARTVNTSDERRIFHTHDMWECYRAGFYASTKEGMTKAECEEAYREFLSDTDVFAAALEHVISEWKFSCEHYLTNSAMNRIAWLGQAAACYAIKIPSAFRSGFWLLTEEEQGLANETALVYLNRWLAANDRNQVTMDEAISGTRQSDIY